MSSPVSVIIAARNSLELLRRFLPPIFEQVAHRAGRSEVLVYDDCSSDGTAEALAREFTEIRLIVGERWLGQIRARNRMFQQAANELIISLDSDIRIEPDFIRHAVAAVEDSDVFAVAGRSLNASCDLRNETLTAGGFDRGLFRIEQPGIRGFCAGSAAGPVLYAPAGASLFRRSVFLELDSFDPLYFPGYGGEDIDYSYRAQKRGYRLAYAPQATVIHHHRGTMKRYFSERAISNIYQRNLLLFTWKNISDRDILKRHLLGLPRELRNPRQARILGSALRHLPRVLAARRREKARWRRADGEILSGVYAPSLYKEAIR